MVKNPPTSAGDVRDASSIPELRRSPGRGHGNPLQYSCLKNPKDRGPWWATVHGVEESDKSNLYPQFKSFYHTSDYDILFANNLEKFF